MTEENYSILYGNSIIKANKDHEFIIPYGQKRSTDSIIITDGKFAKRYEFVHEPENYSFNAKFVLNRESILMGNKANLMIRVSPSLLNEIPVPCELIENAKVNIKMTYIDDLSVDKSFTDVKFKDDKDATFEFMVPENGTFNYL